MAVKRIVDTSFWNDDKVVEMFSPEDKLFMLYIITNPHTTQLGIYHINKKNMAFELGYSQETISILLDRFENKYNILKYSNETNEIAVKNYLKHSIVKGGKPVEDLLKKEINQVKDKSLLKYIFNNIKDYNNLNITVSNILDILNVNDNDNEESSTNRQNINFDIENDYEIIKEEVLKEKENNLYTCEWCGCKTSVIHKHHYPIPKRYGGKEIVNICSNCHNEFHSIESKKNGGIITNNNLNTENVDSLNTKTKLIIEYLNSKAMTNFKYNTDSTKKLIKGRLNKGFKFDDFITVIDKKTNEWLGTDMEMYLRPSTLFCESHFEEYLNQKEKNKKPEWFDKKIEKSEMSQDEQNKIDKMMEKYK